MDVEIHACTPKDTCGFSKGMPFSLQNNSPRIHPEFWEHLAWNSLSFEAMYYSLKEGIALPMSLSCNGNAMSGNAMPKTPGNAMPRSPAQLQLSVVHLVLVSMNFSVAYVLGVSLLCTEGRNHTWVRLSTDSRPLGTLHAMRPHVLRRHDHSHSVTD